MKARFQKVLKSRLFQAVFIAALFLAIGIFLGINSWNKTVYVQLKPGGKGRYVASAEGTEVVSMPLEEYREQVQKKIFGHAKEGEKTEGFKEFYLGSFLIQEGEGNQRICQAYSFLEMKFTALDVSLSGSSGEMVIEAPCQQIGIEDEEFIKFIERLSAKGQQIEIEGEEFIGLFPVPIDEILNNPEKEFFSIEEKEISIRFYDAALALTDSWLLTAVRFFNSPEEDGYVVRFIPGEETDAFELNFQ